MCLVWRSKVKMNEVNLKKVARENKDIVFEICNWYKECKDVTKI